jgi:hypothetical protein
VARDLRLRLWLIALDLLAASGMYGSRAYLWAVERASACVEWEVPRG